MSSRARETAMDLHEDRVPPHFPILPPMTTAPTILAGARLLLARESDWHQGAYAAMRVPIPGYPETRLVPCSALDDAAVCLCLSGAVYRAAGLDPNDEPDEILDDAESPVGQAFAAIVSAHLEAVGRSAPGILAYPFGDYYSLRDQGDIPGWNDYTLRRYEDVTQLLEAALLVAHRRAAGAETLLLITSDDGEAPRRVTRATFFENNVDLEPDEIAAVMALEPGGDPVVFGGGAAPLYTVTRDAE